MTKNTIIVDRNIELKMIPYSLNFEMGKNWCKLFNEIYTKWPATPIKIFFHLVYLKNYKY